MPVINPTNLESWSNLEFPSLEILENQTKGVLEGFNKSRKLDIRLKGDDSEIEKLHLLFNSLTERRAFESSNISMYSEDIFIYIRSLLEENSNIKVIHGILSFLLIVAKDKQKNTRELIRDYLEFLKKFDNEICKNGF